jgi:hypothetical protein
MKLRENAENWIKKLQQLLQLKDPKDMTTYLSSFINKILRY